MGALTDLVSALGKNEAKQTSQQGIAILGDACLPGQFGCGRFHAYYNQRMKQKGRQHTWIDHANRTENVKTKR